MSNDKGGPAFPLHNHGSQTLGLHVTGMDMRDYFAAKAIPLCPLRSHSDAARWCYQMADAMLKARG
jgi:hypothetical protein